MNFSTLVQEVFFSDRHPILVLCWLISGGLIAAVSFALSVVTVPMLLERDIPLEQAVATSLLVVAENVPAMLMWSMMIMLSALTGFATLLIGFAFIMPLLGHASWHAYRDLVDLE
jgi:uncharacterized membrane protein